MIRDIRTTEMSLGKEAIFIDDCVLEARKKLERSIATTKTIKKGEKILEEDLQMLSPGDGFAWDKRYLVIGKVAKLDILQNEIIKIDSIE
jgi:sialic acid synthase